MLHRYLTHSLKIQDPGLIYGWNGGFGVILNIDLIAKGGIIAKINFVNSITYFRSNSVAQSGGKWRSGRRRRLFLRCGEGEKKRWGDGWCFLILFFIFFPGRLWMN